MSTKHDILNAQAQVLTTGCSVLQLGRIACTLHLLVALVANTIRKELKALHE